MAFVELKIDPKYHRHIIGRSGANGMSCYLINCSAWIHVCCDCIVALEWNFSGISL